MVLDLYLEKHVLARRVHALESTQATVSPPHDGSRAPRGCASTRGCSRTHLDDDHDDHDYYDDDHDDHGC